MEPFSASYGRTAKHSGLTPTMQQSDALHGATDAMQAGRGHAQTRITVVPPKNADAAVSHARRLWASAGAAALAETLTMPVDFAKVRLQLQSSTAVAGVRYTGMTDCIVRAVRAEGPGALFKGLGPALARQTGYTGLSFLLYEPIRNSIAPSGRDATFFNRLLAGGTAGGLGISVLNPMEVIKTQIQASSGRVSVAEVLKRILRSDGIVGFWAGLGPNIARTFLVCAAELGTYDEVKSQLIASKMMSNGPLAHLAASGAAGFASASISTPVDVVKTNIMNQAGSSQQSKGIVDTAVSIVTREGPEALYKGFVPILTRKILWCSAFFVTYEKLRAE